MRSMNMTEQTWERLLAVRGGADNLAVSDAAYDLYSPIAGARGRFVLAQVGQSLDGRSATPAGDARDVSGPDGLAHLHRCRALVDAVVVGVGTVKADDPKLSVRMVSGPAPVRVVVDCNAVLDGSESLFHDGGTPVIVFRSARVKGPELPGAETISLQPKSCGLDPQDMLDALAARKLPRILVEGGARTIARFVNGGLVDRLHVAISPIIIGSGPSGIMLSPIERLADAHRPVTTVYNLGSDILFDCQLDRNAGSGRERQDIGVPDDA